MSNACLYKTSEIVCEVLKSLYNEGEGLALDENSQVEMPLGGGFAGLTKSSRTTSNTIQLRTSVFSKTSGSFSLRSAFPQ